MGCESPQRSSEQCCGQPSPLPAQVSDLQGSEACPYFLLLLPGTAPPVRLLEPSCGPAELCLQAGA